VGNTQKVDSKTQKTLVFLVLEQKHTQNTVKTHTNKVTMGGY
jgi:hypothetical protein